MSVTIHKPVRSFKSDLLEVGDVFRYLRGNSAVAMDPMAVMIYLANHRAMRLDKGISNVVSFQANMMVERLRIEDMTLTVIEAR